MRFMVPTVVRIGLKVTYVVKVTEALRRNSGVTKGGIETMSAAHVRLRLNRAC